MINDEGYTRETYTVFIFNIMKVMSLSFVFMTMNII